MAKNLKLNIKNTQIAQAINLSGIKSKLASKKAEEVEKEVQTPTTAKPLSKSAITESPELAKEETPRIRARDKSVFEDAPEASKDLVTEKILPAEETKLADKKDHFSNLFAAEETVQAKSSAQLRQEIFGEMEKEAQASSTTAKITPKIGDSDKTSLTIEATDNLLENVEKNNIVNSPTSKIQLPAAKATTLPESPSKSFKSTTSSSDISTKTFTTNTTSAKPKEDIEPKMDKLGPTGKHIKDYLKPVTPAIVARPEPTVIHATNQPKEAVKEIIGDKKIKPKTADEEAKAVSDEENARKGVKAPKFKEFRDVKPARRQETVNRQFDARDRQGLRSAEDEKQWRKRRNKGARSNFQEDLTIRPTTLKVRIPISIKDLASEMKLKSSQLISKLFLQGVLATLNDLLEDEVTIQLLGHEFGCEITIDTAEEKRIQITDKTIREELLESSPEKLQLRPPVVAFMGHVDHGKTSLIDAIRKSDRAAGEAGAITQHIGAFRCRTAVGDIAILDTPGHEAFSAMRARGADVTDIVVLVVAGDEGIRQQTIEAIQHARAAGVIIVVAINKCDKPNFNADNVYRQLADNELLPEAWGGQTITINCSASTGEGVVQLLEMLALQAEILELKANPDFRARGTVLESEMHKGMGAVATVLVQNGTLHRGDALVFGQLWGRVKTMHDEYGNELQEAGPSTPVEITGLSGLAEAGQEFIVVKNEREAREIAEVRYTGAKQNSFLLQQKRKLSAENLFQNATTANVSKKTLNLVLRADVQGSLEALKVTLMKIESEKACINIIFAGVGEVSESDVQLAAASKAVVIGFHTQIESHAESLVKQFGVVVRLHNIIYHAVDDVKLLMTGLLEKIAQETQKGKALVKAVFKSSHAGMIAGCQVTEGIINRNDFIAVRRNQEIVWRGSISSLKRVKEDIREVSKGMECGILLQNFSDVQENDVLEAYQVTYIIQEL